jgi:hypothetical protein
LTGPIGIAVAIVVKNWDKIESAARSAFDGIKSAWETCVSALKSAVSGLEAVLKAPWDAVASAIQWVIDKVNNLIGALGRIHVPKIDLPGPLSLGGSSAATGTAVTSRVAAPGVRALPRAGATSGGGISITVNGAIDPEATARQIQRILAGHATRVGLAS